MPLRRSLLGASAAAATLPFLAPGAASARAPLRNKLPPAWYRFRIGEFEATVVSDGAEALSFPEGTSWG